MGMGVKLGEKMREKALLPSFYAKKMGSANSNATHFMQFPRLKIKPQLSSYGGS
jgi:hypothetical protein